MNWQIIVGIVFLIGGIGNITKDFFAFLFGLIIGILFLFFGLRKKGFDSGKSNPKSLEPKQAPLHIPSCYIVFDIETTGFSRRDNRIIEIAANKYSNGQLVDQYHTYVNPGTPIPISITQLTGISSSDVKDAPTIQKVKKDVISFFGSTPLVGHNIVRFDIPFLQEQTNHKFNNKTFDTLDLSKKAFPDLPSYKLSFLDQALHLSGVEHHRAGNDILVTNSLFLACANPKKYRSFITDKEALSKIKIEPRQTYFHSVDIHSILPSDSSANPNTPLTGKNIVFSGYFSIPLEEIMQIAVDSGAILKSGVSRKVHYLVVGEQDQRFADENGMNGKSRIATNLIEEEGIDIKIIDEETFMKLARSVRL